MYSIILRPAMIVIECYWCFYLGKAEEEVEKVRKEEAIKN